ncbi:trypsin-like peptidase domain-containing protein [Hellea balneolensis]|uniref:trypsin-like peptidase domain-containing protein n=1 Tax=Hellea balneolensis TaxID=287478 RepID=UPI0004012EBA|nr:trypsin-like peptidase domain-containing protein [Hellea balneolensis]
MRFVNPFDVIDKSNKDERGLILTENWDLKSRCLPIFTHNSKTSERVIGLGTSFRVDPNSWCLTAFHILDRMWADFDEIAKGEKLAASEDIAISALEVPLAVYGSPQPISPTSWRPITHLAGLFGGRENPADFSGRRTTVNLNELLGLNIPPSDKTEIPYWPLKLRGVTPQVGDEVMGLGYANLDLSPEGKLKSDDDFLEAKLFASIGRVTEVVAFDPKSTRPWPLIRVKADWPGGMSGGPVFDRSGNVIGVVSTSATASKTQDVISSAAIFTGAHILPSFLPHIDRTNPGWFKGHAQIDDKDNVTAFCILGVDVQMPEGRLVTFNPITGDNISI